MLRCCVWFCVVCWERGAEGRGVCIELVSVCAFKTLSVCTFKTSPCVPAPRPHVSSMWTWCRWRRNKETSQATGGVLSSTWDTKSLASIQPGMCEVEYRSWCRNRARGCFCFIAVLPRTVRPDLTTHFALEHDEQTWRCFSTLLGVNPEAPDAHTKASTSLPLVMGGLGLRSASNLRDAAHWGNWADTLKMVHERHPLVADVILRAMAARSEAPAIEAINQSVKNLLAVGHDVPTWESLMTNTNAPAADVEEPNQPRVGWQAAASRAVETSFMHRLLPTLPDSEAALLRSQGGPLASGKTAKSRGSKNLAAGNCRQFPEGIRRKVRQSPSCPSYAASSSDEDDVLRPGVPEGHGPTVCISNRDVCPGVFECLACDFTSDNACRGAAVELEDKMRE